MRTASLRASFALSGGDEGEGTRTPRHDELRRVLKERRQRAGLPQRELAARLGWGHKTVSSLERGSKRLTVLS